MKIGINAQDKQKLIRMFNDGASIRKAAAAVKVKPDVVETFAKHFVDTKVIKKAPKG